MAEICRLVDGLPLAVELAAAWVRLFPPRLLATRLERRLPLLTGGGPDLPERQRTMLEQRRRWAEEEGLSPDVIEELYKRLIDYIISREMEVWKGAD